MTLLEQHKRIGILLHFVPGTIVWIVLLFLSNGFPYSFYFENTIQQHQLWFPRFYLLTFTFFRLFFAIIYCNWVVGWLLYKNIKSLWIWLFTIATVFFLTLAIQHYYGYAATCYWGIPLSASGCFIFLLNKKVTWKRFPSLVTPQLIIEKVGVFILYLALCILLPRFHPFAKYTMFNQFDPTTYAYQLRDEKDSLIPIEKYSSLTNDQLYVIGEALLNKQEINTQSEHIKDSLIGKALLTYFIDNKRSNSPKLGAITLYKLNYTLHNNSIIVHQNKLGVYYEE